MGFSPRVDGITDGAAHNTLFLTGIPSNSQGALKRTARALSYGMEAGAPWRLLPLLGVLEGGLLCAVEVAKGNSTGWLGQQAWCCVARCWLLAGKQGMGHRRRRPHLLELGSEGVPHHGWNRGEDGCRAQGWMAGALGTSQRCDGEARRHGEEIAGALVWRWDLAGFFLGRERGNRELGHGAAGGWVPLERGPGVGSSTSEQRGPADRACRAQLGAALRSSGWSRREGAQGEEPWTALELKRRAMGGRAPAGSLHRGGEWRETQGACVD
uniref:Uncharacterized protein n=1 Tax=Zea mays TaxID=4577 RepID=A0A804LTS0_MAIZE